MGSIDRLSDKNQNAIAAGCPDAEAVKPFIGTDNNEPRKRPHSQSSTSDDSLKSIIDDPEAVK